MTSIVILIRHDHQMTISQGFSIFVLLAMLQSHDLSDRVDFIVFHDQVMRCIAYIEKFSTEREHCWLDKILRSCTSIEITSNYS